METREENTKNYVSVISLKYVKINHIESDYLSQNPFITKVATLPGHGEIKKIEKKIEDLNKMIDVKLYLLKFTRLQASRENGNLKSMERLRNTLAMKVEEVHDLKVKIKELRFGAGHQEDEILLWNSKLE